MKLLIKNIGCLQTPTGSYSHKGSKQGKNTKLYHASIVANDGIIKEITEGGKIPEGPFDREIDAEGKLVTPGLVDGHTHLVFGGYRQNEIPMKLAGVGYLDILKAGGGIFDTVRQTREASFEALYEKSAAFLDEMLRMGVTTCEVKSGYGLEKESELKMLKVIKALGEKHAMDVVPTFMGAHAIPPEFDGRGDEYIDMLCNEAIPEVRKLGLAEFCDIFCDDSIFTAEQSRRYLEAARNVGLGLKIHADEMENIGGAKLAGELEAMSAGDLIAADEEGMKAMAKSGTTAMLLPATSFYLDKRYAPARTMIETGIPIAIASDFNPGSCPSLNLQFAINLGYLRYKMTPEEILTAVTINPACAIDRGDTVGTLEVGKRADLVIWNAPDFEMLCYRFGSNLAETVVKNGEIIS